MLSTTKEETLFTQTQSLFMYYWDLTQTLNTNKIGRAILALEMLSDESNASILKCFQPEEPSTILDIMLSTGLDMDFLEWQVEQLCRARVLRKEDNILGCSYFLNYQQLDRISKIAHVLAQGVR
jgi:hypothetical protein